MHAYATRFAPIAALAALAACGSPSTPPAGPAPGGGGADGGGTSPAPTDETVTLTMGPFTVPPSSEVFKCQKFANPFGGADQDVKEYEVHMTEGSHHMFAFFDTSNTNGAVLDCPSGGLEFHPYPFTTQSRDAAFRYPDDVGSLVPGKLGFMIDAHYINPGATPVQATVTTTFHKAAPGTVKQRAGVIFMNDVGLTVPPGKSTSSSTCALPANIHVLSATSHMHQRATGFSAKTADGTVLFETDQWADPAPRIFQPALGIPTKTEVTWGCTYDNETGSTLTFGEFAQTNVMCIFTMQYWPAADPSNPTITCDRF